MKDLQTIQNTIQNVVLDGKERKLMLANSYWRFRAHEAAKEAGLQTESLHSHWGSKVNKNSPFWSRDYGDIWDVKARDIYTHIAPYGTKVPKEYKWVVFRKPNVA